MGRVLPSLHTPTQSGMLEEVYRVSLDMCLPRFLLDRLYITLFPGRHAFFCPFCFLFFLSLVRRLHSVAFYLLLPFFRSLPWLASVVFILLDVAFLRVGLFEREKKITLVFVDRTPVDVTVESPSRVSRQVITAEVELSSLLLLMYVDVDVCC